MTVEVPPELLEKAQRASGSGIKQTVRVSACCWWRLRAPNDRLRQLRGKVRFARTAAELKTDR